MKILLITDTHQQIGGAEKHFYELKKELKKQKLSVYSLTFGSKNKEGKDFKIIKETKSLFVRHFYRLFFNSAKYNEIKDYIDKINPDVIHLHNINKYTISLLKAVEGHKVVQTVHDYGLIWPSLWNVHKNNTACKTGLRKSCESEHKRDNNWLIYQSMLYFFHKRNNLLKKIVETFISPSPELKEYLDKNGFKNVKFIPHFINIKNLNSNFSKIKKNQIMYAGRIEENKGVHLLIDAMKEVVEKIPDAKLKIAGEGSWREKLMKRTQKIDLQKNVEFLGHVKNIDELYEKSNFVIVPSICMEQFGLTTAEAMMHSRAVIGSNRGGTRWLVSNNVTGFVFDPLKNELGKKIVTLLSKKNKIIRFGKESYKRINKLTDKQKSIKDIIKIYKQ